MTDKAETEIRKVTRPITIFCDIDGTLLKHDGPMMGVATKDNKPEILLGVRKKLEEWDLKGYNFILTTGRRESARIATERQLARLGIAYDQLIMGIGGGKRYLVNDTKPDDDEPTCFGITVKRNKGIEGISV